MSKKILLDKINVPGIKTYEVYRQRELRFCRKSFKGDVLTRWWRKLKIRTSWSWWCWFPGMKWSFIDKKSGNHVI
jgi:NADH-quinone oxidoreductase subunit F